MTFYILDENIRFPNPLDAEPEGLLAIGGDLNPKRLLLAYHMGIFPWYSEGQPLLWWSPDPRLVLIPDEIKISKSLKRNLRKKDITVQMDGDFSSVIRRCAEVPRRDQEGTWITDEMMEAYEDLHQMGYAHSVEVYQEGNLIGGLYGISIGGSFFGESMFSSATDGSKMALAWLAKFAESKGWQMIDCQIPTDHLKSLGAKEMSRRDFLETLSQSNQQETIMGSWKGLLHPLEGF